MNITCCVWLLCLCQGDPPVPVGFLSCQTPCRAHSLPSEPIPSLQSPFPALRAHSLPAELTPCLWCPLCVTDIRELIEVDDVMEDESLRFGPNGGLVFCMEYFANNFSWLEESLGHVEDDYVLFDCPGQIELYTHLPVMKQLVEQLQQWEFRVCGVFLVDSQFMVESFKFISGILAALSAMISLEIPQINVMTKMDLLSKKAKKEIEKYLDPDMYSMIEDSTNILKSKRFKKLTKSICGLIDDYGMVRFLPLDRSDEESINIVLQHIDFTIQYGEDLEFKEPKECEEDKSPLVDEYFQDHVDE
uniref:GPN-loop GTPase 3 n=1 Tax=Zonotrichia albicollis TaxID=44394 RepID=A0A8D2NBX8_ZONAL